MRCVWISFIFLFGIFLMVMTQASSVTSLKITQVVLAAALDNPAGNFLNYHVEGACFWLQWSAAGPHIATTLKVNEFLPDAVVTVYNGYQQDPWGYADHIIDPIMHQLGLAQEQQLNGFPIGYGTSSFGSGDDLSKKFKEVDIIGDPALPLLFTRIHVMLIPSEAVPLQPYYVSLSDAYLWRNPLLDDTTHPKHLLPGYRVVGSLADEWGAIFPRVGFIDQPSDFKAAAVLALRAADIATHSQQAHVYVPLPSGSCGHDCYVWPSHEDDFANVKYQEIYPKHQLHAKQQFGINDLAQGIGQYRQAQYLQSHGNYVWVMWRHYEGCIQTSGQFLGSY